MYVIIKLYIYQSGFHEKIIYKNNNGKENILAICISFTYY